MLNILKEIGLATSMRLLVPVMQGDQKSKKNIPPRFVNPK